MQRIVRSLLRVGLAVVCGLAFLIGAVGVVVRQPSLRAVHYTLSQRSDPARLEAHVRFLSETVAPRNIRNPSNLNRAADYIASTLGGFGARVEEQPYLAGGSTCRNIRARFGPASGALLVVGAHYDAFGDLPGADDNASGVAGLLEVGRLLESSSPAAPVELVAYSTEEPPFFGGAEMGSSVHARALRDEGTAVAGMICLEMIGYYTEHQPSPHWIIGLLYPRRGDFVIVVGQWDDRRLVGHLKAGINGAGIVDACSFTGPPILGADLSDHRSYWLSGFTAAMVTDTAFIRNPSYHTTSDLWETLDYRRMAGVIDGVCNAIVSFRS